MLVSALLTSLAINSGLCILFFVLYSILRKQPSNYAVYVPRLLAEGKSKRRSHFNLERLIPSPTWLKNAWKLSEEELLSSSGLDAVVFMRLITFRFSGFFTRKLLLSTKIKFNIQIKISFWLIIVFAHINKEVAFLLLDVDMSMQLKCHVFLLPHLSPSQKFMLNLYCCSLKVFSFAGIIGIFVLLPVNCTGELHIVDFTNLPNNSLDVFTISNIGNGSKRLWIHFSAVYVVTIFICYLLYYEYRYISSKRMAYFYSSKPQPHHFTILVHSIPVSVESSVSESVDRFFSEYHPSTYLSHIVIHRTNRLRSLIVVELLGVKSMLQLDATRKRKNGIRKQRQRNVKNGIIITFLYIRIYSSPQDTKLNDAKQLYGRLTHLKSDDTQQKYHRSCCFGLCGRKVDLTDEYEKQLVDIEKNLRLEQSEVSSSGHKEARAAFVSFKSRLGAAIAFHLPQSSNPIEWVTEEAPEPDDVYWPFFSSSFMHRWISKLTVVVACITLTILFLVPVLIVQGLTNLSQLKTWFPFLESILTIKIVSQVITGYLPSLILQLFLKAVPPIMKFLSSIQGYISHSNIEKSACNKVLWFTIWNVFFATVFSGTAIYVVDIFLEPKQIPGKLAVAVPAQASFFIAYVVTTGWTSVCSELFRIIPFSFSLIKRPFTRSTDHELEVPSLPYHKDIPRILFFALLGITYFFLAPLILPFLLLYLCLGYIIYSNQFINVYAPRYESAGKFWPIVHDSIIFSLVLMHAIAVGIFTLKKLSLASSLICPLPIFTLLFNDYCRKRFLPIFVAYSAESLIKKDRQEENDPEMSEFYNKLVIAYQDPALMPVRFSSSSDGLNSPLISSAQV
ncbi:hypothetical protein FEM48_Zijuj10G0087500 [Ziziphus jujuba var. spinosa]|uniref:CSC1-like protein At1g69450 n=1 Tax=Ziziphus jujuba var. spinosa TaxID=714518 RepID=A0A978UME3_ZIZJJ|nr:hypothetical protein FEM48_Zijuj10G0087500 [Ziziphus jujuba var. spinosa]